MPWRGPDYEGEVPTLGYDILDWITDYLIVPDGPSAGQPLELTEEQAQFVLDFYRVDPKFKGPAIIGRSLVNARQINRAILSRPKGWGKSPILGALGIVEAVGDVILDGWDADGEPVARPWTSLGFKAKVQVLATSEDQTENTWDPLLEMVRSSWSLVGDYGLDPMETFIAGPRLRIEYATSAGDSREGGRPVFAVFDQALALDTPIPTPSGWTTMGALRVGDEVYGSSGMPVVVQEAKPVSTEHDCYRVTFEDGTSVVASAGHLWQSRRASWPERYAVAVRTTEEMASDQYRYRVPVAPAQERPKVGLEVPPYLLGYWLGDGTRAKCELTVSEHDVEELRQILDSFGVQTHARRYRCSGAGWSTRAAVNLSFTAAVGYQAAGRPEYCKALQRFDCYVCKSAPIPAEYLLGSIEQRTELLQGLMDSDGCATESGVCTFVSTTRALADLVVTLLRSLGQVTGPPKWVADRRYTGGGKYRVDFTARGGFQPFRLKRKADRVRQHRRGPDWVTIKSIVPVPRVPVRCIAVDSQDHLFAAGTAGHLTHNTESWRRSNGGVSLAAAVRRNLTKTQGSSIESPNAYVPGDKTVAEQSFKAVEAQAKRKVRPTILLSHREAPEDVDIYDEKSLLQGLSVAYGESADVNGGWVNLARVVEDFWDPDNTVEDSRRYFLNQILHRADSWLSNLELKAVQAPDTAVAPGEMVTLGFDGSRGRARGVTDATALIACRVSDGHVFEPFETSVWEQPAKWDRKRVWQPPVVEIEAAVAKAFAVWKVVGFYADPAKWESYVAGWEAKYGRRLLVKSSRAHPIEWWMVGQRATKTVQALQQFKDAVLDREMTYDAGLYLTSHLLHARMVPSRSGVQIAKPHPDSADKIDAAVAAVLAYQARLDAIAAGALKSKKRPRQQPRRLR